MKLEDIGFYTLSDARAARCSEASPLWRCELILTDKCNFSCPYCRQLRPEIRGSLPYEQAKRVLDVWCDDGLKNVRFSGGEPTMWKGLVDLVAHAKNRGVQRIAISTNGSAGRTMYAELAKAGVDDFSVSLDACCASVAGRMSGGVNVFDKICDNIVKLSQMAYTTVGIVLTEDNETTVSQTVIFAKSLGVSDIRVIPAAQYSNRLAAIDLDDEGYPILRYRVGNAKERRRVRGLCPTDSSCCSLVLDDMACAGVWHWPCIIYLREGGNPIGKLTSDYRAQRGLWSARHDPRKDGICKENCLDVCVDYNNKVAKP